MCFFCEQTPAPCKLILYKLIDPDLSFSQTEGYPEAATKTHLMIHDNHNIDLFFGGHKSKSVKAID